MVLPSTYTTKASENVTKAFASVPPYVSSKKRNLVLRLCTMTGFEFSLNMLEPWERFLIHAGFWCTFSYSVYQLYLLYGLLQDTLLGRAMASSGTA